MRIVTKIPLKQNLDKNEFPHTLFLYSSSYQKDKNVPWFQNIKDLLDCFNKNFFL